MAQVVYTTFIKVWRDKESHVENTRKKRLLLLDTSHRGEYQEVVITVLQMLKLEQCALH
jgi:hypothetical protein